MTHPQKRLFISLDVTFFERTPFFKKSYLQGENLREDRPFEEIFNFDLSPEPTYTEQVTSNMPCTEGNLNTWRY